MKKLSHIDVNNRPVMVDVTDKKNSYRIAKAKGIIKLNKSTIKLINENKIKKGNVLITAELAGINAAKQTSNFIPLCHPIMISKVDVKTKVIESGIEAVSEIKCVGQTGVEMEALTAVSITLLTVYDMCKAVDKDMEISQIVLLDKQKKDLK